MVMKELEHTCDCGEVNKLRVNLSKREPLRMEDTFEENADGSWKYDADMKKIPIQIEVGDKPTEKEINTAYWCKCGEFNSLDLKKEFDIDFKWT